MTHYQTLNLKENATNAEIKASFRKLAAKYHPDKNNGNKKSEEMFKKVNEAYQVLSDKKEKKKYDDMLNNKGQEYQENFDFGNGQSFDDFIKNSFKSYRDNNGSQNANTYQNRRANHSFEGFSGFDFFGENFAKNRSENQEPRINLNLTFWEAALGCNKVVFIPESIIKGNIKTNIKIQPATENGTVLSIKVKNVEFEIIVKIKEDKTNKFTREGLNIYASIDVPVVTAILGGKILFPHWAKEIEVTIPEGTKNAQKLRLKSLGLTKGNEIGHLFLSVNLVLPEKITEEQKDLLKKFQNLE